MQIVSDTRKRKQIKHEHRTIHVVKKDEPNIVLMRKSQWNIKQEDIKLDKMNKTNHTIIWGAQEGKDRATRNPLKTAGELRCPRRFRSSYSTCGISGVTIVTNLVISHEGGKENGIVITTIATYPVHNVMVAYIRRSKWWLQLNH
jgi:PHD/YefM family antitoxin component YafN of YafNO toxin-antitoxin module